MVAIILAITAKDNSGPSESLPQQLSRKYSRAQKADPYAPPPLLQHTAKVVNISTLDNVNSWEQNFAV
jgi:hypothetical protein